MPARSWVNVMERLLCRAPSPSSVKYCVSVRDWPTSSCLPDPCLPLLLPNSRRVTLKSFQCARCQAQEMTMGAAFSARTTKYKVCRVYNSFPPFDPPPFPTPSNPTDSPGHAKYLRKVNLPWLLSLSLCQSLPNPFAACATRR